MARPHASWILSPVDCVSFLQPLRFSRLCSYLNSPQCQPAAIAHLCKVCDVTVLFHDRQHASLACSAASEPDSTLRPLLLFWQSQESQRDIYEIIRTSQIDNDYTSIREPSTQDVAYIHHTSGTSTGLPKPIPQTHHGGVGVLPSLKGEDSATFTTTPLYHGGIADCLRSWASGALIWLFPASEVPITTKNILLSLAVTRSMKPDVTYFSSVPYILQMLAEDSGGVSTLSKMNIVGVGGAALPPAIGDALVAEGVSLVSRFGSAECGFLLSSHRKYSSDKDWQYLRASPKTSLLKFEQQAEDSRLSELVISKDWPHMAKRNRPDGSFATSDLFEAHPKIPGAWRYHSRSDSQITLITGKKFDPAPLEDAICSRSQLIKHVLIFGNGRQTPGALIFPSSGSQDSESREQIWETVQTINSEGQDHTRLHKDMILVMDPDSSVPEKSSKGTILRAAAEKTFSKEIESMYTGEDEPSNDGNKTHIQDKDIRSLVVAILNRTLGEKVDWASNLDFYQHGVDSVKCTQVRSALQKVTTM